MEKNISIPNSQGQNKKIKLQLIKSIVNAPYIQYVKVNSFCSFKSINNILYLIYSTSNISIIFYDLMNNQNINQIKKAHKKLITNIRHYLDNYHKRDLVITVSLDDNNIKLWNATDCQNLLNIENINKKGGLLSAFFLNDFDKKQIYIISSNQSLYEVEPIKLYNLEGKEIRRINDSNYSVYYIDTYYDMKNNKKYIIACNNSCIRSYDYDNNKIYRKFSEYKKIKSIGHIYLIINNKEEMLDLCETGKIRIWSFHTGQLLKVIDVGNFYEIKCFCFMDEQNILIGCRDKLIKSLNLKDRKIIDNFKGHNSEVNYITAVNHDKYGKILISQGWREDGIRIWKINE